jgi:hypothetical protein
MAFAIALKARITLAHCFGRTGEIANRPHDVRAKQNRNHHCNRCGKSRALPNRAQNRLTNGRKYIDGTWGENKETPPCAVRRVDDRAAA